MGKEEDENLFDGIQIMSAEEIEDTITNDSDENQNDNSTTDAKDDNDSNEPTIDVVDNDSNSSNDNNDDDNNDNVDDKNETSSKNSKVYSAIVKDMLDEGIILGPEDEEELKDLLENADGETIKKLMSGTIDKAFLAKQQSWKDSFTGSKKRFLEIEDAFSEPDQAIQMAQRLEFFEGVTDEVLEEDTNLQKNLYFELLKSKGFNDAEAAEAVQEADEIGKLKEKATKALPQLKKGANDYVENARKLKGEEEEKLIKANEERFSNLMKFIDEKESFVDGLKLNKVARDKVKNNISNPVYTDDKGRQYTSLMYKQMRNPAEFEMLINYLDTIGVFNIDKAGNFKPDISKIKTVAKSKAVSELDRVIADEEQRGTGRHTSASASDTTVGILDLLEQGYGKKNKRK
jgi:hypothetical protein